MTGIREQERPRGHVGWREEAGRGLTRKPVKTRELENPALISEVKAAGKFGETRNLSNG